MESKQKWCFTKEQLENTPSRKCGFDADKELSYRQQAANFIQDMGQRNAIAVAALFLAAKVEEQPRRLEHIIKVAHLCLHRSRLDTRSSLYLQQAHELVVNENLLLQTLGFDVAIDHPHTHVVRCCHLVRASKDLARASYFLASNSLHLTTMCLQYKPTVVACFCIHLACKWSSWKIPQSSEGKEWYWYIDRSVTLEQLEHLTSEFLIIFDKCPTKLKHKIRSISSSQNSGDNNAIYLKRRRVDSPTPSAEKSENCANEETEQLGSDFIPKTLNHFGNNLLPNTSNHIASDVAGTPQASTSAENYCPKPSTSSAHSSNFYSDSVQENPVNQPFDRTTMHSFEYMCTILDPEVSHKRESTVSSAKRIKFDVNDSKIDVSKQYDKGECSKKYIYTSYR